MLNNYQKGSIFGAVIVVIVFIFSFAAGPRTQSDPSNRTSAYVGEDHQQEKSFWDRLFNEPVNLFTLGLLLVGGSQAAMFLWQLQLIRESLSDAKTAANAAKESADAGKRSADTAEVSMIASERAYIHYNGMRYISHFDATKTQFVWRIRPTWVNSGNTPPKNLQIFVKYYLANEPLAGEL